MSENVLAFVPRRPQQVLPLQLAELRLAEDATGIKMTLRNEAGDVVAVLEFSLIGQAPQDFDLQLLRASWDEWSRYSPVAS